MSTQPNAKIILDSVSPEGVRLTTAQIVMHRFVLAEFNTHRVFSRNSASSRAIPFAKQAGKVCDDPAIPVVWASEQKGMQGGAEIAEPEKAELEWLKAAGSALNHATDLANLGVHKSIVNRLLEPFMWHTVVVTSTAFENWDSLRLDPDAQPEIRAAAQALREARDASTPHPLAEGDWHLPFVADDIEACEAIWSRVDGVDWGAFYALAAKISAARCARTSYLTHDGRRDIDEDLRLYGDLVDLRIAAGKGIHWSPLEHVATPWAANRQEGALYFPHLPYREEPEHAVPLDHLPRVGNLLGWRSLRTEVEATNNARTFA